MRVILGITGASGAIYGWRLANILHDAHVELHAVVSEPGWQVLKHECKVGISELRSVVDFLYDAGDIGAPIASGSFIVDTMVVVPCSMRTLGAIANGIADNLLCRAADVILKESRKLILVPRETPVHAIHLANMLRLSQMGVTVMPASPGFYHQPANLADLVDMMVGKICDAMHVKHDLYRRWSGQSR